VTKDDIKNKEDFINYILIELNKKVHEVKFGHFFLEISPGGGIDSFRNLLDELHENGLLSKTSEPDGNIPGFPGLRTVDLKYSISLKGIRHLKECGLIDSKSVSNMKKEVFITYSWDSEEHIEKVLSFTNLLRDEGFDAEMDKLHTQNETATDFYKMMHQAMTDYEKVIVVLSKGYKEKAENFRGGVGNEYNLILRDIETQKNKYILVSFEPISDEIIPLNFKGRHIFDLSNKKNLNELYAKLQNVKTIEFAEVGPKKPTIEKTLIPKFDIQETNLEIGNLITHMDNGSQLGQLFTKIEFDLNLEIKNNTKETYSEYNIEVSYPVNSTDFDVNGRIENSAKIIAYDNLPKLFPTQTRTIKLKNLTIRNSNAGELLDSSIVVKIFSDKGMVEKEFPLKETLSIKNIYGEQKLTEEMFHDKNYR
jgi:hypothetical protein